MALSGWVPTWESWQWTRHLPYPLSPSHQLSCDRKALGAERVPHAPQNLRPCESIRPLAGGPQLTWLPHSQSPAIWLAPFSGVPLCWPGHDHLTLSMCSLPQNAPLPRLFFKPQVKHPLLWEALPATPIPLFHSSLPVPQRPMNPVTALTLLNSCACPLRTGHPGPHHAWRMLSIQ